MIRLCILGTLDLHDADGRELRSVLSQPKRLALLAFLATARTSSGWQRRDRLLALFWPELDQAHARDALNSAVHFLRRELGSRVIVSRGAEELGVGADACWCDAAAFGEAFGARRYGEALELYRGELLPGFHCDEAAGFEEWLETERARLRGAAARAARSLAEERESAAHHTTAVAAARRAVELAESDERAVRDLLALLGRLGDRAGALHAFEQFARRLAQEYEAEPSTETRALIEQIRRSVLPDPSPAPAPAPASPDPASSGLNGWTLEGEIGRGGHATVYLARDPKHDRHVALKILRDDTGRTIGVADFLREIAITARLAHPNILPLIDSGVVDGRLYLVTPYVPGESLRARIGRERQLVLPEVLRLGGEIADALDYAHRSGVVHRDVKPENILLADGHAIVMDFGIARAMRITGGHDAVSPAGTRGYMSPEQARPGTQVGSGADVYALGAVLFEMLTGRLPGAALPEDELRRRRPDTPPAVARLVAECLSREPGTRPARAAEVSRRLALAALEVEAASHRRRHGTRVAVGAGVALVLMAAAFTTWRHRDGDAALRVASMRVVSAAPELELEAAISPDGRRVAYASGPMLAMRIYVRSIEGGPPTLLTAALLGDHRWPRWSADGTVIYFLSAGPPPGPYGGPVYAVPSAGGPVRRVTGPGGGIVTTPAWSRDGKWLAYSDEKRILVRSIDRSTTIPVAEGFEVHSPALSSDGRRVAYVSGNILGPPILNMAASAVWLVAEPGAAPTRLTDSVHASSSPAFTPDGRSLLYISDAAGDRDVYQQRLTAAGAPDGTPIRLTTGLGAASLTLSADGRHAAVSVLRLRTRVFAAPIFPAGTTPVSALVPVTRDAEAIEGLDVSPDGRWLAFDSNRGGGQDIYRVALPSGEPVQLTHDSAPDFAPQWSSAGDEIAYYSLRRGNRDVRVMRADGSGDQAVTTHPSQEISPTWSPDGGRLAFDAYETVDARSGGGIFIVARDATGRWGPPRLLTSDACESLRWSPDGRWIAYTVNHEVLRLIDPGSGTTRTLVTARELGGRLQYPEWGPDPSVVYLRIRAEPDSTKFWAVPLDGGRPRLILQLDPPAYVSRRHEWATDGRRLYFTLASDEADVVMLELKR